MLEVVRNRWIWSLDVFLFLLTCRLWVVFIGINYLRFPLLMDLAVFKDFNPEQKVVFDRLAELYHAISGAPWPYNPDAHSTRLLGSDVLSSRACEEFNIDSLRDMFAAWLPLESVLTLDNLLSQPPPKRLKASDPDAPRALLAGGRVVFVGPAVRRQNIFFCFDKAFVGQNKKK